MSWKMKYPLVIVIDVESGTPIQDQVPGPAAMKLWSTGRMVAARDLVDRLLSDSASHWHFARTPAGDIGFARRGPHFRVVLLKWTGWWIQRLDALGVGSWEDWFHGESLESLALSIALALEDRP